VRGPKLGCFGSWQKGVQRLEALLKLVQPVTPLEPLPQVETEGNQAKKNQQIFLRANWGSRKKELGQAQDLVDHGKVESAGLVANQGEAHHLEIGTNQVIADL
jgi:hypothetical protein